MPYDEYVKQPEWRRRVEEKLVEAMYRCQVCNVFEREAPRRVWLEVHHRTYVRRGDELWCDLVVLCNDCHDVFHRFRRLCREGREHPWTWLPAGSPAP